MAPSSRAYRTFATTFEALEAPYYRKETVLQYPGRHLMNDAPEAPPKEEIPSEAICQGPLIFDPSPPQEEGEDVHLAAANNQAELMRWQYRLIHLTFPKLK